MAVRYGDTRLLANPVRWDTFSEGASTAAGVRTQLQSPQLIPSTGVYESLYPAGGMGYKENL